VLQRTPTTYAKIRTDGFYPIRGSVQNFKPFGFIIIFSPPLPPEANPFTRYASLYKHCLAKPIGNSTAVQHEISYCCGFFREFRALFHILLVSTP